MKCTYRLSLINFIRKKLNCLDSNSKSVKNKNKNKLNCWEKAFHMESVSGQRYSGG